MNRSTFLQTLIAAPAAFFGLKLWKKETRLFIETPDGFEPLPQSVKFDGVSNSMSAEWDKPDTRTAWIEEQRKRLRPGESIEWDGEPWSDEYKNEYAKLLYNLKND